MEWVFAGGDAVSGPSSVVEAIAAGERAAAGIDAYLTGEAHAPGGRTGSPMRSSIRMLIPIMGERPTVKLIPVAKRKGSFAEVELTLPCAAALSESKRCLTVRLPGKRSQLTCQL